MLHEVAKKSGSHIIPSTCIFMFTESFVDQRREYVTEAAYSIGIGTRAKISSLLEYYDV